MIFLSNEIAFERLRNHKKFEQYISELDLADYPGLNREAVYSLIQTGVLTAGLPLESVYLLVEDIKLWVSRHSHGGRREGAGAPKSTRDIRKVTLSAEHEDIVRVKTIAKERGTSLQQLFRSWLAGIS